MPTSRGVPAGGLPPPRTTGLAPVAVFFLLAYALTWACWLPLAGAAGADPPASAAALSTLGQFGPFIAALIVAGVWGGWPGLRDLPRRLLRWRVNPVWYAAAVFLPPALAGAAVAARAVWVGQSAAVTRPDLAGEIVPQFVYVLLLGGPLGEEPGWRGFALPRLQAALPPLAATLVLALAWAGWHLPLWWVADVPCSFAFYVVGVVPLTYLFTWLSDRSAGSLPVALLFHASVNTCIIRLPLFQAFEVWTALLWATAGVVYALDRSRDQPAPALIGLKATVC